MTPSPRAAVGAGAGAGAAARAAARPNLIVIMLDSFRQDHVGAYHGGRAPFPGIDPCRTPSTP